MTKEHTKQHYIPQCYLKNFSENEKFVYIYSKKNKKKGYPQSISKTACIDFFYSISEKYIKKFFKQEFDVNFIEKRILAENIESLYSNLLNQIIQKSTEWISQNKPVEVFNAKERDLFAALIAIQYLRMPNIRELFWSAEKKASKERNEIISAMQKVYGEIDCSEPLDLDHDEDYAPVLHAEIFLDEELIANIQDQIIKKIWIYFVANGDAVFTSDNPILLKPHLKNQTPFFEGFGMKGVEIVFPVSKNIILTIWDEELFTDSKLDNNNFKLLTSKQLRQYNCYQYIWANDEVYSSKNDFKLIELLKVSNGDINKEITKDKPTIKVNKR